MAVPPDLPTIDETSALVRRWRAAAEHASGLRIELVLPAEPAVGPREAAGRIELLPFLREQSVSITAHRFGFPDAGMLELPV